MKTEENRLFINFFLLSQTSSASIRETNRAITGRGPVIARVQSIFCISKDTLKCKLITLRKSLLSNFLHQFPKGELPVSTVPELLIGFSDHQVSQVLENCDKLFSVSDVNTHVEIWKETHAQAIMDIISDVFQDIDQEERQAVDHSDYCDGNDEEEDYWNELFMDTELMNFDWEDFESGSMPELGDLINKVQIE